MTKFECRIKSEARNSNSNDETEPSGAGIMHECGARGGCVALRGAALPCVAHTMRCGGVCRGAVCCAMRGGRVVAWGPLGLPARGGLVFDVAKGKPPWERFGWSGVAGTSRTDE